MPNNMMSLITNNIIAIVIHICMLFIMFYSSFFIITGLLGTLFFFWLAAGIYTIIVLSLYFLAGRLFLYHTKNSLTDAFSVIMLFIILLVGTICFWSEGADFLSLPIYPLGDAISHTLGLTDGAIERKYIFMILSPLLPLSMWTGLRAKQYVGILQVQQQPSTLKNRLMLVISKKKQSFILFIALICSAYLSLVFILVIMFIMYEIGFY